MMAWCSDCGCADCGWFFSFFKTRVLELTRSITDPDERPKEKEDGKENVEQQSKPEPEQPVREGDKKKVRFAMP
jgi:hypothetical protein